MKLKICVTMIMITNQSVSKVLLLLPRFHLETFKLKPKVIESINK